MTDLTRSYTSHMAGIWRVVIALLLASVTTSLLALGQKRYIETTSLPGRFPIVRAGNAAPIYVDADDYPGVKRAATDLKSDIARVTGVSPVISNSSAELHTYAIIIGDYRAQCADRQPGSKRKDQHRYDRGQMGVFSDSGRAQSTARNRKLFGYRRQRQTRNDLRHL